MFQFLKMTSIGLVSILFLSLNGYRQNFLKSHNSDQLLDNSVNPPASKTGAPGETACTSCHTGSILSALGVVDFNFSGLDSSYIPGQIYNLSLSIPTGIRNGFELTILDGNNIKAGDFIDGVNTSTTSALGREYIRHSVSSGITLFQFQWTAPPTEKGNLRAFYAFNKSNGDSATTGDKIYLGSELIYSEASVSLNKIIFNSVKYHVFWNPKAKQLKLDYNLDQQSNVLINIQTIDGRLVEHISIGQLSPGLKQHNIEIDDIKKGIYIVSLFIDNQVYNKKVLINWY